MDKNLIYKREIVRQLYFVHQLSCAEVSNAIDKSVPFTTKILTELIIEGSVKEMGQAMSTGGRRPTMYSLSADRGFIVSVAMDQFVTRIVIANLHNSFATAIEKFDLPLPGNPQALVILADKIEKVIEDSGIERDQFIGIGIGMPGFVDVEKGINYTFLKGPETITKFIQAKTGLPVYIDNDSSLIALAEMRFGAAVASKNAMVINIGWGIGLGLVLNGELFRGHNGFAGEFSHIPIFTNGKLCTCGKRGCLETESSLLVMIEKAKEGSKNGRPSTLDNSLLEDYEKASEQLISAVQNGDSFVVELFSGAGYTIGRGVAILVHILNPELIVLSGRGSVAGKIWQAPIQQALNEHCIPRLSMNTDIRISKLGYDAELIGAAALVMEHYHKELTAPGLKNTQVLVAAN